MSKQSEPKAIKEARQERAVLSENIQTLAKLGASDPMVDVEGLMEKYAARIKELDTLITGYEMS